MAMAKGRFLAHEVVEICFASFVIMKHTSPLLAWIRQPRSDFDHMLQSEGNIRPEPKTYNWKGGRESSVGDERSSIV